MPLVDADYYRQQQQTLERHKADLAMLADRLAFLRAHRPDDARWIQQVETEMENARWLIENDEDYLRSNQPRGS